MKRALWILAVFLVAGCQTSEAQRASLTPSQAAADRLVRQHMLGVALQSRVNESIIEIHAARGNESLDVSIASILVSTYRHFRGNENHERTLRTSADLANAKLEMALEMLGEKSADATYVANVAKVGSLKQQVTNDPKSLQVPIELKWNEAFTVEDAREVVQILPLLKSATDAQAFTKAKAAIQQELERSPDLLAPFKNAKPTSPDVARSRQRVFSLIADARRSGGR